MARILYDRLNEIKTKHLSPQSVTGDKIAPNAIEEKHIRDGVVTRRKIADGTVGIDELVDGSVTTVKIAEKAVTSTKIMTNAVGSSQLAVDSVTTEKVKDGAITTAKIRDGAITREKVADQSVRTEDLVDGAVTNAKIAANTITAAKIAANAVGSSEIAPNAVGYSELASQSVEPRCIKTLSGLPPTPGQVPVYDETGPNYWWFKWASVATRPLLPPVASEEIAPGAVTSSQLSVDSVITEKIANGAVTQEKLAPGVGGDRFVFGTLLTGFTSADALYLVNITADIPYTPFDLSPWVPEGAKAVLVQLGMFNQAFATGRAFFRVRTNVDQRDAVGLGLVPGLNSQVANAGIVPLVVGGPRTIEYALESVGGPWNATLTLYITVVGYIM
ncbi:MAG: hypothetical protein AB1599_00895 [Planctomycetota bacterium]